MQNTIMLNQPLPQPEWSVADLAMVVNALQGERRDRPRLRIVQAVERATEAVPPGRRAALLAHARQHLGDGRTGTGLPQLSLPGRTAKDRPSRDPLTEVDWWRRIEEFDGSWSARA